MTVFIYIIAGMLAALLLAASVAIVYKAGEQELICKYSYDDTNKSGDLKQ